MGGAASSSRRNQYEQLNVARLWVPEPAFRVAGDGAEEDEGVHLVVVSPQRGYVVAQHRRFAKRHGTHKVTVAAAGTVLVVI